MLKQIISAALLCVLPACGWGADANIPDIIDSIRQQGHQVNTIAVIAPVFSQLVRFNLPEGFSHAFEQAATLNYIHEFVLKGETMNQWSQMITLSSNKGVAEKIEPAAYIVAMASGFKRACPASFSVLGLGKSTIDGYSAFTAVVSCGTSPMTGGKTSETAVITAIKGEKDYYTFQWAERAEPSATPLTLDKALWTERAKELNPIKLCAIIPDEKIPYPSCANR